MFLISKPVFNKMSKTLLFGVMFFVINILLSPNIFAVNSDITRSYNTNSNLINGELVSLTNPKDNSVQLSTYSNQANLIGVYENNNQNFISINPIGKAVQVATYGTVEVLVSNINGYISVGNKISVSPIKGVGMRSDNYSQILGIAQSSFTKNSKYVLDTIYSSKNIKENIRVGYIKVLIMIGSGAGGSTFITGVQNLAKNLTGKPVSDIRLVISLIIAIVGIISIVVLIYSGVDGTLISLGRNPLAKKNIFRVLKNVFFLSFLVLILTVVLVYLILWY